jgi:hypothetical protein
MCLYFHFLQIGALIGGPLQDRDNQMHPEAGQSLISLQF